METRERAGHGEYKIPGGKLVVVDLSLAEGRIARAQVSGDFFLEPATALDAIDAALVGLASDSGAADVAAAVSRAIEPDTQMFGITPDGIGVAVRRALDAATGAAGAETGA